MIQFRSLIAAAVMVALMTAGATHAAAQASPAEISKLIEQLSGGQWEQRNDAQQKLIDIGEATRPLLSQALESTDNPEMRVRAQAILAQLDGNKSTGAAPITLHLKDASPEQVFAELSKQYGERILASSDSMWRQRNLTTPVTIDIDNKPFWVAMQEISARTGVRLTQYGEGLRLQPLQAPQGIEMVSGPCLFVLQGATYSRSVQIAGKNPPSVNFSLNMYGMVEPKVRILSAEHQPELVEAVDDKGNSLLPPADPNRGRGFSDPSNGVLQAGMQLVYPQDPGKKITRLKGTVNAMVQSKSEKIEIPDIQNAKNVVKTVKTPYAGEIKLTMQELQVTNGQQYTVKLIIESAQPWPSQQYGSMFGLSRQIALVDANGMAIQNNGGGGSSNDRRMESTINFYRPGNGPQAGEPVKLVWEVATEVKPLAIPFEFTDVPMP